MTTREFIAQAKAVRVRWMRALGKDDMDGAWDLQMEMYDMTLREIRDSDPDELDPWRAARVALCMAERQD